MVSSVSQLFWNLLTLFERVLLCANVLPILNRFGNLPLPIGQRILFRRLLHHLTLLNRFLRTDRLLTLDTILIRIHC